MGLPYDLKNTVWVGYENPYTPPSEVFYSVNFTVGEYTCTSIGIKNMGSPDGYCLVALPENESTYMILYSGSTFSWLYNNPVELVDGDDIANVDLLNFMYSSVGYLDDMAGSYWTWPSSETFEDPDGFGYSFEFSAGGTSYYGFYAIDGELTYYPASGDSITAYDSTNGWASDDYKSFIVTDAWQDDENIQDLLTNHMTPAFLPAPDVIISYKGTEIATMSESGTKTLQTQGKYCEDDIVISYTKPSGGGVGEIVYKGLMTITHTTNLWQYIDDSPATSAYIVILQNLSVNGNSMDFMSAWTLYGCVSQSIDRAVETEVSDRYDDYSYNLVIHMEPQNQKTTITGAISSLRADVTKIIKIVL